MARLPPDDIDVVDALGRAVVAGDAAHDLFAPLAHRIADVLRVAECAIYTLQAHGSDGAGRGGLDARAAGAAMLSPRRHRDLTDPLGLRRRPRTGRRGGALRRQRMSLDDEQRRACSGSASGYSHAPLMIEGDVIGLVTAAEKRGGGASRPRSAPCSTPTARPLPWLSTPTRSTGASRNATGSCLATAERDRWRASCGLSLRDDMTGLFNRRGFFALATQQFKLARRVGTASRRRSWTSTA